jgi:Flp pilus assembly pilin Flp
MMLSSASIARLYQRFVRDRSGLAVVEFALTAPFVLGVMMAGTELTNFVVTKMRVSQVALHIADNGSRIGTVSLLTAPQITEADINDLLEGAKLQAGKLDLYQNGRVIVSSFEPVAIPNTTNRYMIRWQRCRGLKNYTVTGETEGTTNMTAIGPATRQITSVPDDTAVIYVRISYNYKPIFSSRLAPQTVINEVAAMTVRDSRDFAGNGGVGIYNPGNAPQSLCSAYTA